MGDPGNGGPESLACGIQVLLACLPCVCWGGVYVAWGGGGVFAKLQVLSNKRCHCKENLFICEVLICVFGLSCLEMYVIWQSDIIGLLLKWSNTCPFTFSYLVLLAW